MHQRAHLEAWKISSAVNGRLSRAWVWFMPFSGLVRFILSIHATNPFVFGGIF
ncbi:hypothetical protein K432DRAFT_378819 [Lepidopterella palustris CBS 459.81]|uniref:Uncharacterized protein n=1 Tax=Lepidopterella palustris CBS 459.81 TaxID=1314670 RepID=A0A8E2JIY7_9PEZI|nr:hypothetical protein K432DRAFT_378819 [Lepidopterella palustris CBS 459.81]